MCQKSIDIMFFFDLLKSRGFNKKIYTYWGYPKQIFQKYINPNTFICILFNPPVTKYIFPWIFVYVLKKYYYFSHYLIHCKTRGTEQCLIVPIFIHESPDLDTITITITADCCIRPL